MNLNGKTISTTEESVLKNDLLDIQDWWDNALAQLCDMDASDTAYVTVYQDAGSAQTDITGHDAIARTVFTGYLVC